MSENNEQLRITLIIVMVTSFLTPFTGNAVNLAIPSIGIEFNANQNWINWVASGFLIPCAAFLLPFGHLADCYGRKKIFTIGMSLLAATSFGCATATSLPILISLRVIQGIASAMIFSNSMAILTSVVPPHSRGKMLGLASAAVYLGLSAGPVLGGFISNTFSWRGIFWFNVVVASSIATLTILKLKGEWLGVNRKIDMFGIFLCILTQFFLLFGLSKLVNGLLYQLIFIVGIILLVIFVLYELRQPNPVLPIHHVKTNKPFIYSNLANFINYSSTAALSFLLSLYLQTAVGLDTLSAGFILLTQPIIMAILSPFLGALSDRVQPRILSSIGMGITAIGLFCFVFLSRQTPTHFIVLNLAFVGVGLAFFSSPNTNAIMSSVDKTLYGAASSMMANMRLFGQSISIAIVSVITATFIQDLPLGSPNYVDQLMISLKFTFITFAILSSLGILASLSRGKVVRNNG